MGGSVRVTLLFIGEDGAENKRHLPGAGGCGVNTVTDLASHDIQGGRFRVGHAHLWPSGVSPDIGERDRA